MAGMAAVFTADTGVVSTAGMAAAFTVGMVATIRAIMDMAIPHTVTTATDRVQLAAWNGAGLERSQSSAGWAGLWIFNALHLHPPAGAEYLSAGMPAYPESASLKLPFKLAKAKAE
jgi:hypothetical protein